MTPPAVLSDMDGTLVDSVAAAHRAWAAWGRRRGIDGVAHQQAHHGRPAREVIALIVDDPDLVDEDTAFVREAEIADVAGVVAFPGAAEVLALPRAAIVTSCELPLALARLRAARLPVPEVLVTADQIRRGKPAPDAYLLAAERLGVDPAECVVLEDAPAGVEAGRAAGMSVWAVTTTHDPAELRDAHRVAGGLSELLPALRAPRGPRAPSPRAA
ncbi:MAG: HAD-IA family hydrolase [Thermoleophilia bacterium]